MSNILEQSSMSIIIALSDTEVGKIILPNTVIWTDVVTGEKVNFINQYDAPSLERETAALVYVNTINELLPQFIRKDEWTAGDGKIHDMIVMERLYILPIHHFDLEIRQHMIEDFEAKMKELHDNDFVHGDFCRPTSFYTRNNLEWMFKNIVQTDKGSRLLDTGFSRYLIRDKNIKNFVHILFDERNEIEYFKKYYLDNKE